MSVDMAPGLSKPGATVTIFGRKVSWDSILVAGAGLLGVIFLAKFSQSGAAVAPMSTVDPSGGGADVGSLSTVPTAPTTAPTQPNYGDPGGAYMPASQPSSTPAASFSGSSTSPTPQPLQSGALFYPYAAASALQAPQSGALYYPYAAASALQTAGVIQLPASAVSNPSIVARLGGNAPGFSSGGGPAAQPAPTPSITAIPNPSIVARLGAGAPGFRG